MRSSTAAGGLVPTGEASTATETNFNQPPVRFHSTEETDSEASSKETNLRTLIQYASYDSSVFQESNLLPAPSGLRLIETKPMQNMTFDPVVLKVVSAPARFWDRGARWFVVRLYVLEQFFWGIDDSRLESLQESHTSKILCRTCSVFSEEIR